MPFLWNQHTEKWWLFSHVMPIMLIWVLLALFRFLQRLLTSRKDILSIKVLSLLLSSIHCICCFKRKDRSDISFNLEDWISHPLKRRSIYSSTHIFRNDLYVFRCCVRQRIQVFKLLWNCIPLRFNPFIIRWCNFLVICNTLLGPNFEISDRWWVYPSSIVCDWVSIFNYSWNHIHF